MEIVILKFLIELMNKTPCVNIVIEPPLSDIYAVNRLLTAFVNNSLTFGMFLVHIMHNNLPWYSVFVAVNRLLTVVVNRLLTVNRETRLIWCGSVNIAFFGDFCYDYARGAQM